MRPPYAPKWTSFSSENAAHRFAVKWNENGFQKQGVYIPRRDTSSKLNSIIGGSLFPGVQHYSKFEVSNVHSSYFSNTKIFSEGSVHFDHALLMKNIHHKWVSESSDLK